MTDTRHDASGSLGRATHQSASALGEADARAQGRVLRAPCGWPAPRGAKGTPARQEASPSSFTMARLAFYLDGVWIRSQTK